MEVAKSAEVIARTIGRYSPELKPYVLKDISEIHKSVTNGQDISQEVEVGRGSFARVIELDFQGVKCVGKVLHKIFFEVGMHDKLDKFFKEIKLLSKMNHSNIVKFLGIYYKQVSSLPFELPVLVMEKMEFTLEEYLSTHEKGSISKYKIVSILLDVSRGLVFLHEEMKVAHRDLSSNNILLAADLSAKISDLGGARVLDRPGGWDPETKLSTAPGTAVFMPPEALEDTPKYTVSVDVFSFGCVMIHLCTHKWPIPIGKTAQGKPISEFERRWKHIVEMDNLDLLPIVKQCLEESSEQRPTSLHVALLLENVMQITEFTKHHGDEVQQCILENVREIPGDTEGQYGTKEKESTSFKTGLYAKEINLIFSKDTHCVGQVLDASFFSMDPPSRTQSILEKLFSEIQLLSKMKHPNIVRFIGIFYRKHSSLPVLVTEKMEYTLTEYLSTHKKGSIPEDKAISILLDVSEGLAYLHNKMKIIHGDLSSDNILLAADLSAKIADLGSARVLDRPGGWSPLPVKPDSMHFMPPEVLKVPPKYSFSVDVFSFGCVIIHLMTHKWPSPIPVSKRQFSEIERRQEYISEMANSNLLPIALHCLEERRPALRDILCLLKAKISTNGSEEVDYTVVFTGITGAGKSTAGNFFLNKKSFSSKGGVLRGSKVCSASTATICGKTIKIIDTPGFFDGFKSTEDNFNELSTALTLAKNGVHAVAFVMGRYIESCEEAIKQLLRFKGMQPFLFVLVTHAENEGIDKIATEKYIEKCLSSTDCPPGFRNLVEVVKNRVIMLESVGFVAHNYREQKCRELVAMIENVNLINDNRMYTNGMLQLAALVYEKAKFQQETEIQEITESLASNTEKIKLLTQQVDDCTITASSKEINDEIAALEEENETLKNRLEEIKDEQYLELLTKQILKDEMIKSKITGKNMFEFARLFGTIMTLSAIVTPIGTMSFALIGGGIGAAAGTIIPVMGTGVGVVAGARVGAVLGSLLSSGTAVHIAVDNCNNQ